MKHLALLVPLTLVGCQTADIDTALQRELPRVCSLATTAHVTFIALGERISESNRRREAQLWSVIAPICADPANVTATSALIAAATGYVTFALTQSDKAEN